MKPLSRKVFCKNLDRHCHPLCHPLCHHSDFLARQKQCGWPQAYFLNQKSNATYRNLSRHPTGFAATYPYLPTQYSSEFPEINDACSDEQKHTALAKAAKWYDLYIKTLKTSGPNACSETERAMAVEDVLRQKQMS